MKSYKYLSVADFKEAALIKEQIEILEAKLCKVLGNKVNPHRKMSDAARAKIAAGQKKRWAKVKAAQKQPSK